MKGLYSKPFLTRGNANFRYCSNMFITIPDNNNIYRRETRGADRISRCFCTATNNKHHSHYDVVINGGGVVGSILALKLLKKSKGHCKILLIENQKVELDPPSSMLPMLRVYALSPKSIEICKELNIWSDIMERSQPYKNMQIWEENGPGLVRFHSESNDHSSELGRICEDLTIQRAAYKEINRLGFSNISNKFGASIRKIEMKDKANENEIAVPPAKIIISSNNQEETITTSLLVGADGSQSLVRKLSNIPTWGWGYGQEAIVATVKLANSPFTVTATVQDSPNSTESPSDMPQHMNHTAWQKYLTGHSSSSKGSTIALLPLWNGYSSIVWSTSTTEAQRLKQLGQSNPSAFVDELNNLLRQPHATHNLPWSYVKSYEKNTNKTPSNRSLESLKHWITQESQSFVDGLMAVSLLHDPFQLPPYIESLLERTDPVTNKKSIDIASFPLQLQQASHYVASRLVLIGDAAHAIHPQAGQGLNLGLLDVETLSEVITDELLSGGDIGDLKCLQGYERDRYVKNLSMMLLIDQIHRIFINSTNHNSSTSKMWNDTKSWVRSVGMLGIHNSGPIKNIISKFASGYQKLF